MRMIELTLNVDSSILIPATVKVEIAPEVYISYVINKRWYTNIYLSNGKVALSCKNQKKDDPERNSKYN